MWLVARQAINLRVNFCDIRWVEDVGHWVALDRMPAAELQRQNNNLVLREIIIRKLHAAVENRERMLGFKFLGLRVRPVALQAESIGSLGAQQVIICAAVRFVAGGASLLKCRLMPD